MTREEKANSCFLSLKKVANLVANTPLWIDKIMGILCIVEKGWDREHSDNGIGVMGGNGLDGDHVEDDGDEYDGGVMDENKIETL